MARQGPRRYAILHRYASGEYGPWEQGTTVELTPTQAAWVNRDSPGTLAEIEAGVKLETGQPVPPSKLKDYKAPAKQAEPEQPPAETAASTKDEGAPVATQPRGRASGTRKARGG